MQHIKFSKIIWVVILLLACLVQTQAQKRKNMGRTTSKKSTTKKTVVQNSQAAKSALLPPNFKYDSLPVKPPRVSLEPDFVTIGKTPVVKPVPVLDYEPISEDDVLYRQRVWRDIDVREKINQPFAYSAEENNGSQQFIYVLLAAIRDNPDVVAYNAIDDRFTKPLTRKELVQTLVDDPEILHVPDWEKDSTGNTFKDSLVFHDFNPARISRYRLKEDWVFDKKTSRLVVRILGIAPIEEDSTTIPGMVLEKPLFWLYYPKLRNTLAGYQVYNSKNHGARPTWESLFESRMFNSYIVKSTLENPGSLMLKDMPGLKENGRLRLNEGEKIKNTLLDYEQNLWSY